MIFCNFTEKLGEVENSWSDEYSRIDFAETEPLKTEKSELKTSF